MGQVIVRGIVVILTALILVIGGLMALQIYVQAPRQPECPTAVTQAVPAVPTQQVIQVVVTATPMPVAPLKPTATPKPEPVGKTLAYNLDTPFDLKDPHIKIYNREKLADLKFNGNVSVVKVEYLSGKAEYPTFFWQQWCAKQGNPCWAEPNNQEQRTSGPGIYDMQTTYYSQPGTDGSKIWLNDQLQKIVLPPGWTVTLFVDDVNGQPVLTSPYVVITNPFGS